MEFGGEVEGEVEESCECGGGVAGGETAESIGHYGLVGLGADGAVAEAKDWWIDGALEGLTACDEIWSRFPAKILQTAGYDEGGSFS